MKIGPSDTAPVVVEAAEAGEQKREEEEEEEEAATPKLSLSSLPRKPPKPQGRTVRPPPYTAVSVPFQWEEAPGKPRPFCATESKPPTSVRCLKLPPRLLNNGSKVASIPSSITVMDGPHIGRSLSSRWSLRSSDGGSSGSEVRGKVVFFGSSRWTWASPKAKSVDSRGGTHDDDDHPFSSTIYRSDNDDGGRTKVKKTMTVKRGGSSSSLSHGKSKSQLLVSMIHSNLSPSSFKELKWCYFNQIKDRFHECYMNTA
ncbi:hypothetical protein SAY86_018229 [Trapa natans]|uniref:Uncharacterized protein n=1 Tax=Trapa natans TaxID=22666 RepID=A0AAN7LN06_TRANT|nr:hypothetical protein SAY86_018229 [Trapa natans]